MGRLVAIVGRPNVGKSTLFNRLTRTRDAIVNDTSGTTRDRQYGIMEWNGMEMSVVDTGGWVEGSDDIFESEINKQVYIAIEEADVILFMVDVKTGITDLDDHVARILRKSAKPVIVVSNKDDNNQAVLAEAEFYALGLGKPYSISAINGTGTGDLLDEVVRIMPEKSDDAPEEMVPRFAIVGRPNAGKSSLINSLMDEERNIVTDIAGTTRDSIYTRFNKFGFDFYLVDTAGIRKKNKVNEDIEYYSVLRSIRAIENADVCLLLIDATRGIEAQDVNIFSIIQKNRKGLVVLVNKWDIAENKGQQAIKYFEDTIRERFAPFTDFPIIFGSALTRQRILKALEKSIDVYNARNRVIPTSQLNNAMQEIISAYPPPAVKGKFVKIKYVTMLQEARVPSFVFFCNLPQWIRDPYKRYLENQIRERWDFSGTPINLYFRQK
ncbi:MAG: ribosome biogenesis GTPase Der [Muribaculaceae bacterium]|nr:ribosome biogenesis GTPase Der [Muribaculaceae bacterium]